MKYKNLGSIAVVTAALLWSVDGLLRRQLFTLPPSVVVFWEHAIGFLVLLPFLIATFKGLKELTKRQWSAIVLVSLLSGVVGTLLYTAALFKVQFIPFSVVVLLQQLNPIFAITASAILLKEPLTKRFYAYAVVALVAAYALTFPTLKVNLSTGAGTVMAALMAIGAAAAWGTSTALSKYSLKGTNSLHVTGIRFGLTPIFALLFIFASGDLSAMTALSTTQWWYILAIVFSTGLVALAIYYFGLKRIPASRSSLLELAWPLSAAVIGYAFLGERLSATQWLGGIVLVGTIYLVARDAQNLAQKDKDKRPSDKPLRAAKKTA